MGETQTCTTCRFYGSFGTCTRDWNHVKLNCKQWVERWDDMAIRVEAELVAMRTRADVAEAALAAANEREEAWQLATGLEVHGDPDGITPKHLEDRLERLEAFVTTLRADADTCTHHYDKSQCADALCSYTDRLVCDALAALDATAPREEPLPCQHMHVVGTCEHCREIANG